jgi:hypothetical protein
MHRLIVLLGRPASGKSEILDYLQRLEAAERLRRFRVGAPVVLDDFPLLWAWFEEDEILDRMGKPRLHSTPDQYFLAPYFWEVLVRRLGLAYEKVLAADDGREQPATAIIEFSRGTEHGGYRAALAQLPDSVLDRAGILYVRVSYEESLRKNRQRFDRDRPDSILGHSLPDDKMERLYRRDDWEELERADAGHLAVRCRRIPAVVFENEDDVTTPRGEALGRRLEDTLGLLWSLRERL